MIDTAEFANREAVRYVEEALNIPVTVLTTADLIRDLEAARAKKYADMHAALDALSR